MTWYADARALAADLAGNGDIAQAAGVIAALSPRCGWARNVTLARDALAGRVHGQTRATLARVAAILAGADPAAVLPMHLKTGNFWRCIADPADPGAVTIDRHAHDIAAGRRYHAANRGLSHPARYAALAECYRQAARAAGILPSQVQAITWLVQTEERTQ
jgi:hypothetical protein